MCQCNTGAERGFDANCTLCAPGAVRNSFASGPAHCCLCPLDTIRCRCQIVTPPSGQQGFVSCLFVNVVLSNFHNDLKFTTDGQQNQTSHEPRSRAFYYSINSLLHTWNSCYTEPPMKVPITPNYLEYSLINTLKLKIKKNIAIMHHHQ